jgi:hypothetical protein
MDNRSELEKKAWEIIGPPLYYCEDCLKGVTVTVKDGQEPVIKRRCECNGQIIAPRKAIASGKGGMSLPNKIKLTGWKIGAAITGRCV